MAATRAPIAMVTGARQGIGRGIALAMAAQGFDLVLLDIAQDAELAETMQLVGRTGRRVASLAGDIAALDAHPALVASAFAAFGTLDCLVNNAGVQVAVRGDLLDATVESFDRVMGINLRGTFFLTQAVARRMVAEPRDADAPARSIVTISSANVYLAGPDRPEYCLSKTALSMMTKMFALRLAPHGIMTYEVRPGIIRTGMTAPAAERYDRMIAEGLSPVRRWGEPADVGRVVASLAVGAIPFSTGDAFHVDGGLHIPKL